MRNVSCVRSRRLTVARSTTRSGFSCRSSNGHVTPLSGGTKPGLDCRLIPTDGGVHAAPDCALRVKAGARHGGWLGGVDDLLGRRPGRAPDLLVDSAGDPARLHGLLGIHGRPDRRHARFRGGHEQRLCPRGRVVLVHASRRDREHLGRHPRHGRPSVRAPRYLRQGHALPGGGYHGRRRGRPPCAEQARLDPPRAGRTRSEWS
jgi:hypothetical protein